MKTLGPYRFWGKVDPHGREKPAILAEIPEPTADGGVPVLRLYDPIDSYGGYWGVSAKEFAAALDALPDTAAEIRLHINSPGGDVFEGIAIASQLRRHKARVVGVVDGIAASIASVIAIACDELVMAENSTLMAHDAWGVCIGNSADMRQLADLLDRTSDNIAAAYATKTGGTAEEWRARMQGEAWFSAEEAVDAGLAERVEERTEKAGAPSNSFDLSGFKYGGRAAAPSPADSTTREEQPAAGGPPSDDTEAQQALLRAVATLTEHRGEAA